MSKRESEVKGTSASRVKASVFTRDAIAFRLAAYNTKAIMLK